MKVRHTPGFFFAKPGMAANRQDMILNETFSKSRERAEAAFGKTQSHAAKNQSNGRSQPVSEIDAANQARDEKTSRLRALRMAKEASDLAAAPPSKTKPGK